MDTSKQMNMVGGYAVPKRGCKHGVKNALAAKRTAGTRNPVRPLSERHIVVPRRRLVKSTLSKLLEFGRRDLRDVGRRWIRTAGVYDPELAEGSLGALELIFGVKKRV